MWSHSGILSTSNTASSDSSVDFISSISSLKFGTEFRNRTRRWRRVDAVRHQAGKRIGFESAHDAVHLFQKRLYCFDLAAFACAVGFVCSNHTIIKNKIALGLQQSKRSALALTFLPFVPNRHRRASEGVDEDRVGYYARR